MTTRLRTVRRGRAEATSAAEPPTPGERVGRRTMTTRPNEPPVPPFEQVRKALHRSARRWAWQRTPVSNTASWALGALMGAAVASVPQWAPWFAGQVPPLLIPAEALATLAAIAVAALLYGSIVDLRAGVRARRLQAELDELYADDPHLFDNIRRRVRKGVSSDES